MYLDVYPSPPEHPTMTEQMVRGAEYVLAQYLPRHYTNVPANARLLRETPYVTLRRRIYLNDNYVAYRILRRYFPDVASEIRACLYFQWNYHRDTKYSLILGDFISPIFPIMGTQEQVLGTVTVDGVTYEVRRVNYTAWIYDYEDYADLCAISGLYEWRIGNVYKAHYFLRKLKAMWDGIGLKDRVYDVNGFYSTYKNALALLLAERLGDYNFASTLRLRCLQMQDIWDRLKKYYDAGQLTTYNTTGFITNYLKDLSPENPSIPTNVETTCFVCYALTPYVLW
jgi:hypothetical protein